VLKAVNTTGDTIYQAGPGTFTSDNVTLAGAVTVNLELSYIGPGGNATRVMASPKTVNLIAMGPGTTNMAQLSAQAFDASGAAIPRALYQWTALDTTVVGVQTDSGTVYALAKRGSTKVIVQVQGGAAPTDTVTVNVALGASGIQLVSGGGQTGAITKALADSIVVKAVASDGVPVAGAVVLFSPAAGGGSVSPTSATTNASGIAQTTWTLGGFVGTQSMTASNRNAPGFLTVMASATGTAGGGTSGAISATTTGQTQHGQVTTTAEARRAPGPTSP
jgi:hypothetical protein